MAKGYTIEEIYRGKSGVDPAFAARLKELRKKTVNPDTGKPYTQRELAARIGVSTTSYNGYEHGVLPMLHNLKNLADVLQCSLDTLVGAVDVEGQPQMSSLGDVARAFLGIAASGCINTAALNEGTIRITNDQLRIFLSEYFEVYSSLQSVPSVKLEDFFRKWVAQEFIKLDSTPIETDSQNIDAE
ncbi:MAG: helix-turn-helix transcriptional regulator [Oscillibacter sp.]|nr:helix-turn-helix transcriptional regulator [Oscillibacter sp.]